MMHSTLHFAAGMLLGTALTLRSLLAAWGTDKRVAPHLGRCLVAAYGIGLFAIVPNLLRRIGVADAWCESGFMNIFLLAPMLNRIMQGGAIVGPFVLGLLITAQYGMLLLALKRAKRP